MWTKLSLLLLLLATTSLSVSHWGGAEDCTDKKREEIERCRANITQTSNRKDYSGSSDTNDIAVMADSFQNFMKMCKGIEKKKKCDQLYTECGSNHFGTDSNAPIVKKLSKKICRSDFRKKLECVYMQASKESVIGSCAEISDKRSRFSNIEGETFTDIENQDYCLAIKVYLTCLREPIEKTCGLASWDSFRDVLHIMAEFAPNCNPSRVNSAPTGGHSPTLLLLLLSSIVNCIAYESAMKR